MSPNKKKTPVPPVKPAKLKSTKTKVALPAAMSKQSKFESNFDSKTVLKMEEFITNLTGSEEFQIQSYVVNPGYGDVFPYLSTVAPRFQFYRFKKLHFEFRTRCGSTKEGVVGMAPEYNPEEQPPNTIQLASNVKAAISDVPWRDICLKCDPKLMFATAPHKSVRNYRGPESITYDAMRLNLWCEGQASTAVVGALYAIYEIELWAPQIQDVLISPRLISDYYNVDPQNIPNNNEWTPFSVANLYDPLKIGNQDETAIKAFSPPPGAYRIILTGNAFGLQKQNIGSPHYFEVGLITEGNTVLNKAYYVLQANSEAQHQLVTTFYVSYNYVIVPNTIPGPKKIWIAARSQVGLISCTLVHLTFEYA